MSGASSRLKGAQFERQLVRAFRRVMPGAKVRRGLQARGGHEVADIDCPVFWVEAKRGRKPNVRAALTQAHETAPEHRIPMAVIREDHRPAFAVMELDDLFELIEEWWQLRTREAA